ncbi:ABC transporter ATP-binding protein [Deinococcus radiopugnans]|uniref:ABC-2 type transport system ATP-binding protein n=1 Tax=Deinococcus radiopugnans ATCC 19172 TaxID=585398 RepID=A0A5C4YA67_9DEIO|nr:ATP-binding cassette domain-containing protein [Deinococcus radiopugnans]MBB6015975.1 ABC-2 type transport system ATP-binding protein [Deinococcus radiopugnans ATCC 19172]TNM72336.1 ATP-binding cassette domain-containing protein [Deinococcus radiopugnans ATCC 19172]
MSYAISTQGLTKTYGGRAVVESLDLCIPPGSVYGFLGPNGAGKSTTMKLLLGLTRPTKGRIEVLGQPLQQGSPLMRQIGSMIEAPPGYGHLTGWENLQIVQHMLGLQTSQIERVLEVVRLTAHRNKLVRNYSLGMKQRLGIAMALAREPKLLILDEPTNGLDPAGIEEIRELLVHLAQQGITVMVSSHLLDEINKMATHLGILSEGRLIFQGTRDELFGKSLPDLVIESPTPQQVAAYGGQWTAKGVIFKDLDKPGAARLLAELAAHGIEVYEAARAKQSLEEAFIKLTSHGALK